MERPAHQWKNGSDLSEQLASDAPSSVFIKTGAMPLAIAGEGRSVGLLHPGARVPGDGHWLKIECPPTRRCRDCGLAHGWRENAWSRVQKSGDF